MKSTDLGRTWTSISGDLPDGDPAWTIVQDHINPNLLFVGTEFGLSFTMDGGAHWIKIRNGMPHHSHPRPGDPEARERPGGGFVRPRFLHPGRLFGAAPDHPAGAGIGGRAVRPRPQGARVRRDRLLPRAGRQYRLAESAVRRHAELLSARRSSPRPAAPTPPRWCCRSPMPPARWCGNWMPRRKPACTGSPGTCGKLRRKTSRADAAGTAHRRRMRPLGARAARNRRPEAVAEAEAVAAVVSAAGAAEAARWSSPARTP